MSQRFTMVWNFSDYLEANRIVSRMSRKRQWLVVIAAISVGVIVSNPMESEMVKFGVLVAFGLPILVGLLACALGFWIVDKLVLPWQARRQYERLKIDGITTDYEFDGTGVRVSSALGTSNLDWQHITRWLENDSLLLLMRTQFVFFAAPKSQVDADTIMELRAALIAASIPKG